MAFHTGILRRSCALAREKPRNQRLLHGKERCALLRFIVQISMQVREPMHHVAKEFFFPAEAMLLGIAFSGVAAYDDFSIGKGDSVCGGRVVQKFAMNTSNCFIIHHGDFHYIQCREDMSPPGPAPGGSFVAAVDAMLCGMPSTCFLSPMNSRC